MFDNHYMKKTNIFLRAIFYDIKLGNVAYRGRRLVSVKRRHLINENLLRKELVSYKEVS